MPQAIYTAAKGLYEEAGSGFSISDAPIIFGTQTVELKQIVYQLTFTGVTTVNDVIDGSETTAYQNQSFVLYDADGNAVTFEFNHALEDNGSGSGIAANAGLGDAAIAIADDDTATNITTAAETAISGYGGGNVFGVTNAGTVLTVYVKKPGLLSAANLAIVAGQEPLDTIAGGATTAVFTATALGGASVVSSNLSDTTNQIHGAGLSVVTLESDDADAGIRVPFADGTVVGQEKLIDNSAVEAIILTGVFNENEGTTGTQITIDGGDIVWLIWNGTHWCTVNGVGSVAG